MKFRHAGAGRHPGVAVGGNTESLDSGFRRNDEKEKSTSSERTDAGKRHKSLANDR
jgi:hypothetical protein